MKYRPADPTPMRLPDKQLTNNRWMARRECGRVGYGNTLADARAEMEGR